MVAAESMDLGICYIGAIRNDPTQATELLGLPENVYPVFGLCIGYPAENPEVKPRLPVSVMLKENNYNKWLVIEAEQDPKKANPLEYAKIGHNYLNKIISEIGYKI